MIDKLTDREREVLALMCLGYSNQEIAARLIISIHTVKARLAHIIEKLDAGSSRRPARPRPRPGLGEGAKL